MEVLLSHIPAKNAVHLKAKNITLQKNDIKK